MYFDRHCRTASSGRGSRRVMDAEESGLMLVNMTTKANSVYVSLMGRTPLRTASANVLLQLVVKSDYVLY